MCGYAVSVCGLGTAAFLCFPLVVARVNQDGTNELTCCVHIAMAGGLCSELGSGCYDGYQPLIDLALLCLCFA